MPKLIVGLGNPGPGYAQTRHNVGFRVIDACADRHGLSVTQTARKAQYAEGRWRSGERFVLLKPQTYMNHSGNAVAAALQWYKATPQDLVVVYDDMDLEVGRLRLRLAGSSGGHNGVQSIIDIIGPEFARVRIGVGRPLPGWAVVDWVLTRFTPDDQPLVAAAIDRAAESLEMILTDGFTKAMNVFNRSPAPPGPEAPAAPTDQG